MEVANKLNSEVIGMTDSLRVSVDLPRKASIVIPVVVRPVK